MKKTSFFHDDYKPTPKLRTKENAVPVAVPRKK